MHKVLRTSVTTNKDAAQELVSLLERVLKQGKKVVWLISGGSSVPVAVPAFKRITTEHQANLYISLVDDYRKDKKEHGENWNELNQAGLTCQEILPKGSSLSEANDNFETDLKDRLEWADFAIGQFGIGAGYHTGGIQPKSAEADTKDTLAKGYFLDTVEHLTITPGLIKKLDVAFINSMGESKRPLVQHFLTSKASVYDEPTQALKSAQQTVLCSDVLN